MKTRRNFLLTTLAAIPALKYVYPNITNHFSGQKAIILSTWDSGVEVNKTALKHIQNNESALDAVEKAGIYVENEVSCCVGLGGNPDREGKVTLDACIMDHSYNCGSVSFLQRIKNPVSVARRIMEKTPHIMLVGKGAEKFAVSQGFPLEKNDLSTEAKMNYENWLKESKYKPEINIENKGVEKLPDGKFNHDTMGTICMDKQGRLAGMCTTSGMAFKIHGRVGDSPLIGGGLYVDGEVGAATASGQGEEVIRVCGTHLIVEYMRQGYSPKESCKKVIERIVNIDVQKARHFQVGFIALSKSGKYGAYSIHNGFTYALTQENGETIVEKSDFFFSD